jgi:uncharacterized phage protein (TIGR01671 family)
MKQREIKFRAWDRVAKAMSPAFVLFGEFTLLGAVHDWQHQLLLLAGLKWDATDRYDSLGRLNDLDIMQYTGLLDKNGKEIYEGDIVRVKDAEFVETVPVGDDHYQEVYKDIIGEILFVEGGFCYNGHSAGDIPIWSNSDYEVIGNIHENPELLTEAVY